MTTAHDVHGVRRTRLEQSLGINAESELLLWDGRLDNRDDVAMALATRRDIDSADLASAAYRQEGLAGLGRLVGDWRLVIADKSKGAIVLATDFAGSRPLFYWRQADLVLWSTDLSALVEATGATTIDEEYIARYIACGGSATLTPFSGIRGVRPGHAVYVNRFATQEHALWQPPVHDICRYREPRRYDEQFLSLFREAVAVRLATSTNVVAELSGGFDSSSVVCMASQLIQSGAVKASQLHTVSYVYRQSTDMPFIEAVKDDCRCGGVSLSTHEFPMFDHRRAAGIEPADQCPVQEAAAEAARSTGATTFLTGQGGDALLGNWLDDSSQVAATLQSGRLRESLRQSLAWSHATRVPAAHIFGRAIAQVIAARLPARRRRDAGPSALCDTTSLTAACRSRARESGDVTPDWTSAPLDRRAHIYALAATTQFGALRRPVAMHGVDYTHPFFHRPLLEFLLTIPANVLCGPGEPRRLMRRALCGLWPAPLRTRRSKGLFSMPYLDAFAPFASALLTQSTWHVVERGWIDRASFIERLGRMRAGLESNGGQLRRILLLEHWIDHWYRDGIRRLNVSANG